MAQNHDSVAMTELLAELRALRTQVTQLAAKVASLEGAPRAELQPAPAPQPAPAAAAPAPRAETLPEEILMVLSAAVAAFLGKRARIRGIRVLGSTSWALQGRVSIQASHALPSQR